MLCFASHPLPVDQVAVVLRVSTHRDSRDERQLWECILPQGLMLKAGDTIVVEFGDRRRRPR
jgi:hypothetical protein